MTTFERKFPCLGVCDVIVTRLRRNLKFRNRIYYKQNDAESSAIHLKLTKDETSIDSLRVQSN